jgi:hypothetical protein
MRSCPKFERNSIPEQQKKDIKSVGIHFASFWIYIALVSVIIITESLLLHLKRILSL